MHTKSQRVLMVAVFIVFSLIICVGSIAAKWVPDDEGNLHWWEPPKEHIYHKIKDNPTILDQTNAEVIFAMDTSGSMNDEFDVLCARINTVIEGLRNQGIYLEPHIYGINQIRNCTEDTVYNVTIQNGGTPTVNHSEDWGPAIVDLSNHYPWQSGYVRVVIPMSDEGTQDGDYWDNADEQVTDDAINAATGNNVLIIPVLCSSWYQEMHDAADRMAQGTHGRVFTSNQPDQDLVDGIIDAINDAVHGIEHTGVSIDCHIDDAWLDPVDTKVYKLPGDIIQLVCQVTNNSDKAAVARLIFDYPDSWNFVQNDSQKAIKQRKNMNGSDIDILSQYTIAEQGKVTISNISVAPSSRSKECLVRLIIPKGNTIETSSLSFKVEWDNDNDPGGQKFATQEKILGNVNISKNIKRFILTNRHLLYNRYGTGLNTSSKSTQKNEHVNKMLANIYKLGSLQGAYIFYIDQWDLYDNFSGNGDNGEKNPDCGLVNNHNYCQGDAPLLYWDREAYYDCSGSGDNYQCTEYSSMSEDRINAVAAAIDEYTHYWADETGGKNDAEHWLLIIGDDKVIPFYRAQDPTEKTPNKWTLYKASDHTKAMAKENWIFTESRYQDTDGDGWGDGKVDDMYVGRIVSHNAENLKLILQENITQLKESNFITAENVTLTSGNAKPATFECVEDILDRKSMLDAKPYFTHANYGIVCQSDGTCSDDCKNGNWFKGCLLGSEHKWDPWCSIGETWDFNDLYVSKINAYYGHGSVYGAKNFKGYDFNSALDNFPSFHFFTCLSGLADGDAVSLNVYSLAKARSSTILAATTITNGGPNGDLEKEFYEKLTGQIPQFLMPIWKSENPASIGKALNEAKRNTNGGILGLISDIYDKCNFAYTLYGLPWIVYKNPQQPKAGVSSHTLYKKPYLTQMAITSSQILNQLQKTVNFTIDKNDYKVADKYDFQFVEITGFDEFNRHQQPVLPVKRLEVNVPLDANNITVSIVGSDSVDLGAVNIPVFNDYPPVVGAPPQPLYLEAPASLGVFDAITTPIWFEADGHTAKSIIVDVIPVVFDAQTKATTLYKNLVITISYETDQEGVLHSVGLDKSSYHTGEAVSASVIIENTSTGVALFDVQGKIKDVLGQEIEKKAVSVSINSGDIDTASLGFSPISSPGAYFLEVVVFDGQGQIGKITKQFSVSSGRITEFVVPEGIEPGGAANFSVSFLNNTLGQLEVTFKILFYKNYLSVGETIPVVVNIPSGQKGTVPFQWDVPNDFSGKYIAVAKVNFEGGSDSESKDFFIGQSLVSLAKGWNLISLCKQPPDNTIPIPIDPIPGKYSSVWAFQNNSWKVYDPYHPGFSDLSTMEAGWGYWINMTETGTLTVTGTEPSKSLDLIRGWNLVGYNSCTPQAITDALASIDGKYISVWLYINGQWKVYDPANPGLSDLDTMEPGYGYWIKTTQNCAWTLP